MASINDLKSGPNETGNGIASGTEDGGVLNFGYVNKTKVNVNPEVPKSTNGTLNLGSVNVSSSKRKLKATINAG